MNEEELNARMRSLHRISLCLMGFALFVFLVLCVLQAVYAVVWLLLCVLTAVLLAKRENVLFRVERVYWRQARRQTRERLRRMGNRLMNNPVTPSADFVPDHLLVSLDAGWKRQFLVDSEQFTIGARPPCSCVLEGRAAAAVSTPHCRITYRRFSRAYYIEDLFSLNGTFLGMKKLEPNTPEKLPDNAEIKIGPYTFRFIKREA